MTPFNRALTGVSVPSGAKVSPGGMQGVIGIRGIQGPKGEKGDPQPGPMGPPYVPPPGVIWEYGGDVAPSGWLLCDGAQYFTTDYPELFAVIGFKYGGSGVVFNVPPASGRMCIGAGQGTGLTNRVMGATGGAETHVLTVAELAQHNHQVTIPNAAQQVTTNSVPFAAGAGWSWTLAQALGSTNSGSNAPHNNMPPFYVANKIIKT